MMTFARTIQKIFASIAFAGTALTDMDRWRRKPRISGDSSHRGLPLVAVLTGDLTGYGDRAVLCETAERTHWDLRAAGSSEEAWRLADQLHAPVILYDRDIQETQWREAVGILSALPHRPMVILISRVADEYLWNELFRIGGFDILRKPLRASEVERTLSLALSYWRSETALGAKPATVNHATL